MIMSTINITLHPNDDAQVEAVKAFMKALKIKFEISKEKTFRNMFKLAKNVVDSKLIQKIEESFSASTSS